MKISKFDKANLNELRAAVDAALAPLEAKFNVKLSLGSISFTETTFVGKLAGTVVGSEPIGVSAMKKGWPWTPEDVGAIVDLRGLKYKIVGLAYKGNRVDHDRVIAELIGTKKQYLFGAREVLSALGRQKDN